MNSFCISGRLVADPVLEKSKDGVPFLKFRIAHNRRVKDREETSFFDCKAWETGAEQIAKHFKKGQGIYLRGYFVQEEWDDKATGQKRSKVILRVERFDFPLRDRQLEQDPPEREAAPAAATNRAPAGRKQGRATVPADQDDAEVPF